MDEEKKRSGESVVSLDSLIGQLTAIQSIVGEVSFDSQDTPVVVEEERSRVLLSPVPTRNQASDQDILKPKPKSTTASPPRVGTQPILKPIVTPEPVKKDKGELTETGLALSPRILKKAFRPYNLFKVLERTPTTGIHCMLGVGPTIWGGGLDGTIGLWHRGTGRLLGSRQAHKARIFTMFRTDDGNIWTAADDNRIRVWTKNAAFFDEISLNVHLSAIVLCGSEMWCGSYDEQLVKIVDVTTRDLICELSIPMPVRYMYCDVEYVWICSDENIMRVNRATREIMDIIYGIRINSLLRVNDQVWGCSSDSTITVYDRERGTILKRFEAHEKNIYFLALVGDHVWSGGWDKTIRLWDTQNYSLVSILTGHTQPVSNIMVVTLKTPVYIGGKHEGEVEKGRELAMRTPSVTPPLSMGRQITREDRNRQKSLMMTKSNGVKPNDGFASSMLTTSLPSFHAGYTAAATRASVPMQNTRGTAATLTTSMPSVLVTTTTTKTAISPRAITTTPVTPPERVTPPDSEKNLSELLPRQGSDRESMGSSEMSSDSERSKIQRSKTNPRGKSNTKVSRFSSNDMGSPQRTPSTDRLLLTVPNNSANPGGSGVPLCCTVDSVWTSSWDGTILVWL